MQFVIANKLNNLPSKDFGSHLKVFIINKYTYDENFHHL